MGYVVLELVEIGKVICDIDVFGFGVLVMEIVCGRKVIELIKLFEEISLVNWVF